MSELSVDRITNRAGNAASTGITPSANDNSDSLATTAWANNIRDRANHTGTQEISTITNLQSSLNSKANTSNALTKDMLAGPFAPSLVNGWQPYPAPYLPGYTKSASGIVTFTGLIRFGTYSSGTLLFALPVGFRPLSFCIFSGLVSFSSTYAILDLRVSSDGNCQIFNPPSGNPIWVSLSSIVFQT